MNIWYSFHLNINMPFEKSRINEKQESLYGQPTSFCCFPEALREYGAEVTLPSSARIPS